MQGSDFHVPGKNYIAQPGGQVGGGGVLGGTPAGRRLPLGGLQPIRSSATTLYSGISSNGQTVLGNTLQTPIPGTSISSSSVHHSASSEMGKQTHLQTQPPAISQVYAQNPTRSASQNTYYSTPRPQQSRNINHRNPQSTNQSQIVNIPGAGNGQPTAIYPPSNITIPSVYVPGQMSGQMVQPNAHPQNVYSMSNQMSMQFSGPPQRHQTHQSQFSYPSYQAPIFAPSGIYSYGPPQPGFFYHQPHGSQLNMRGSTNTVGNNNQHVPTSLNSGQTTALVTQASLSQQPQASPALHSISMSIPQTDIYASYNSGNANATIRSIKKRTKAITDIVNPATGRNISDEIYKDDATSQNENLTNKESLLVTDCKAEVVADFAAKVAILASESPTTTQNVDAESCIDSKLSLQNQFNMKLQDIDSKSNIKSFGESKVSEKVMSTSNQMKDLTCKGDRDILTGIDEKIITIQDSKTFSDSLPSNIIQNVLKNDSANFTCKNEETESVMKENTLAVSQEIESVTKEKIDAKSVSDTFFVKGGKDDSNDVGICEKTFVLQEQCNTDEKQGKENEESSNKNAHVDIQQDKIMADGIALQKQKSKNKIKLKEMNRKIIEKNLSDVDISVNQEQNNTSLIEIRDGQCVFPIFDKEENIELSKEVEDKNNYELKKEQNIQNFIVQSVEENIVSISDKRENKQSLEKKNDFEESSSEVTLNKENDNDLFYKNRVDIEPLLSIVAQKNDENNKVSGLSNTCKDVDSCLENSDSMTTAVNKIIPSLKYTYSDDQWSPINTNGKKVYDRDFLMKLQNDPNSKIKPINLPDLDVVLKDITKMRNAGDLKSKEVLTNRHDSLFPGFIKSLSAKAPPPAKKNHPGKPKANKPSVIHVSLSLREDIKLRETENAWKPTRLMQTSTSEEQSKTEALYKRVRSVLNKLTPQKFDTLVNQVRELQIDTQERLQGVIDLVFEKAVDEPNFSVAYALMCKELSDMQVRNGDSKDTSTANFRKLILTRCQTEFEKNTVDENARSEKLKEIEECLDSEKKKELQMNFEEEERRMRIKSVGNIRFIGELFKQNMLTCKIMHQCIRHLLQQQDEENLECLCKLLTTIGKALESKNIDLSDYFKQMQQIANRKGKISSRIRFMLQDVIDLRANKWVPRRDDSNPKTIDQIQKEAESERLDIQLSNTSMSTPRKDDRVNERKRNRGGPAVEDGWIQHTTGRTRIYTVETAKLKNKPPSVDDMQLGCRVNYQWPKPSLKMTTPNKFSPLENVPESDKKAPMHLSGSRSTGSREYNRTEYKANYDRNTRNNSFQSNSTIQEVAEGVRNQSLSLVPSSNASTQNIVASPSQMSEDEFKQTFNKFFEEYISGEEDIEEAAKVFKESFPISSHENFVRDIINTVLEKSEHHLRKTSQLLQQILTNKYLSSQQFKNGLGEILEVAGDLLIDIPKLWKYFAKILVYPIINDDFSLNEMKEALQLLSPKLCDEGETVECIAELLSEMNTIKESTWTAEKWKQSGLQWRDFSDDKKKIDMIVAKYKLEYLKSDNSLTQSTNSDLNIDKVHNELISLLKDNKFDDICDWIQEHIGDKVKEPIFIRTLMTAILESSVEQCSEEWIFKTENFDKLKKLIQRYVDADDSLELQCLFAVQAYIVKLNNPPGILLYKIMNHLYENNVLSNEAFLAWEKNDDEAEKEGKSDALLSLESLFTLLKEVDGSSGEEA